MKEWIKFEKDESEEKSVISMKATRYTIMMLIARLLLDLGSGRKESVEILLMDLKDVYIPITIKALSEKTAHEEVTKTE